MERREVRQELLHKLPWMADFDAFCQDCFPAVFREMSPTLERQGKTSLLLSLHEPAEIHAALRDWLGAGAQVCSRKDRPGRATGGRAALRGAVIVGTASLFLLVLMLWLNLRASKLDQTPHGAMAESSALSSGPSAATSAASQPASMQPRAASTSGGSATVLAPAASSNVVRISGSVHAQDGSRISVGNYNASMGKSHGQSDR